MVRMRENRPLIEGGLLLLSACTEAGLLIEGATIRRWASDRGNMVIIASVPICTVTWSIDNLGFSGVQHRPNLPGHERLARSFVWETNTHTS